MRVFVFMLYICVCVHVFVCMLCICLCCVFVCIYMCICVYLYVYLCVCVCVCVNLCVYWRASETLSGVTQLKIGDVCLFIYLDVRMSFCTLTLTYFCVRSVFDPVPNFTKQNPPV